MIDFKKPDYASIYAERAERLQKLRSDPELLQACHIHYKNNPWDFVNDWGMTCDPRNIEKGLPAAVPFLLFDRQITMMKWLHNKWSTGEPGLIEKTRDCGATWIAAAYSVSMWRYHSGFAAGFGSRKEELVDKSGDPKTIFEKIRFFIDNLPHEFRPPGFNRYCSMFMRIVNPDNGATITGEAGDNIGRGGRQSIYFVDESAFIANQAAKDAALSQNTNCQIDISTPNGNGNEFYKKRMSDKVDVFVFDWRDDPRKDQTWYDKQCAELDEVIVAQEIDRDYNASQQDSFVPAKWVTACIDAHKKLGWSASGYRRAVFDPADVGDARGYCYRHGNVIKSAKQKKDGDIRHALPWLTQNINDDGGTEAFVYDGGGMGAPTIKLGVQDDFEARGIELIQFDGSAGVDNPDDEHPKLNKANIDAFANRRAQFLYKLRERCEATYNAVEHGVYSNPDDMISFDSESIGQKELHDMVAELSRTKRLYNGSGKIIAESKQQMKKRGVASPNVADCIMMSEELPPPKFEYKPISYKSEF